ncbi:major facilitator superfamily domain-containing protein [Phakopsora pachyrhizi]|nr:major facilitator superfamily domain-containing protein [Phakopsora pachyrhizi]
MTSLRKTITLICAILASLSAGTNYAYSAYSPQLGQRLSLSSTSLNLIGLAGNLGMYVSSPLVGRIIDRIGPRKPLLCAAIIVFSGYGLLRQLYESSSSDLALPLASLGTLLTGTGSSAALSSSASSVARSFDSSIRATVIGTTLAGFGLSAFFWTGLGRIMASGEASSLLTLLTLGPPLFMLIGSIGCRPDISHESNNNDKNNNPSHHNDCQPENYNHQREISGWALARECDFWLIWIVMGCCCGTTLMVINNIGTIVETLYESEPNNGSQREMRGHQAAAVSMISLFNCLGRIFAGVVSDFLESRIKLRRVWWLTLISSLFLISQLLGLTYIDSLRGVPFLSGLVGFAYGNIYGTAPALVLEWFGLRHFTTNFGFLNLAPLLTGQIFNISFGRIYDHHRGKSEDGKYLVCKIGTECYRTAFGVTAVASSLALGLSIYLGITVSKSTNIDTRRKFSGGDEEENRRLIVNTSAVIA